MSPFIGSEKRDQDGRKAIEDVNNNWFEENVEIMIE